MIRAFMITNQEFSNVNCGHKQGLDLICSVAAAAGNLKSITITAHKDIFVKHNLKRSGVHEK